MQNQGNFKRSFTIGTLPQRLPPNFADTVLDLECELDACWNSETVQRLMELYTVSVTQQAIEHYCTIASPKFKLFQDRLQALLVNQDERNQKSSLTEPGYVPGLSNVPLTNTFKVPKTPRKAEPLEEGREKATVDKILFAAETVGADAGVAMKVCLNAQKSTLDERLQARKAARRSRKPKLAECDRGGGLDLDDAFEEKLQKFNADLAAEKVAKLRHLKAEFEASMADFLQMEKSGEL